MQIQNLNTGLVVANKTLLSATRQQSQPQQMSLKSTQTETTVSAKTVSVVLSSERKSALIENSSSLLKSEFKSTPLSAYDSISEFEQLQQLSDLIGIDVQA